jgi:tetratricopeptide (TPR) repeat protein
MPDDRSRRSRPDRPGRPPAGRRGRSDGRTGGRPPTGKGQRSDGGGGGRGGRPPRRRDARVERPEPRTEAERRAAEVRARRGPRRTPRTEEHERAKIEERSTEEWIDEGSIRAEAEAATARATGTRGRSGPPAAVDPDVAAQIRAAFDPARAERLTERLAAASAALDRERFDEARRIVTPLARELPHVAAVHEVSGLANYRLGRWKQAAQSLELARQLHPDPALLPVLADCYRAQRRWLDVDTVWDEVKSASPSHDVMAEARIVVAGSLADRGDLKGAIAVMKSAASRPKRVREHHLRQWYVLADLYDRAGETVAATRWFRQVADHDPGFADVRDRLRVLGR